MSPGAATVSAGTLAGWDTLTLETELIEVVVLPGKGAGIYSIVDKASGVDVLFKTPWGLQPPGAPARAGSDGTAFLENYEGGWQELLPNTNDACEVDGVAYPFHGEVATAPWSASVCSEREQAHVDMSITCALLPLRLQRTLTCDGADLWVRERVTNLGPGPVRFVWGHHLVLGAPLVGPGARLSVPGRTLVTPEAIWEDTARLEPGQVSPWPHGRLRAGGEVDLTVVPGPETGSHDDVYITDLRAGWARLWNADLALGFELGFDSNIFRWVISWQPYGGAHAAPLGGSYGLGLEPWTAGGNLAHAIDAGQALTLPPFGSIGTDLVARVLHADTAPPGGG